MSVLILKNISTEGPGTIEDFLGANRISHTITDLSREAFPAGAAHDTLVMMGGPMSVNDADIYPYIDKEAELARVFMRQGKKVLGVCLGAQVMAKALGARVYPGREKEIGWYDIELTEEGARDRLMETLVSPPHNGSVGRSFKVFHWHGETFDIPAGAENLAKTDLYPHQAFRYGKNAYAFQFHIEVRKQMIFDWLAHEQVDLARIERETDSFYADYAARAINFYSAFFKTKET
jgi:GMP synthase-like glutamine amidotransferase